MLDQIIKFDHNDPIPIPKSSQQITPKCHKLFQNCQNCNVFDSKKINFRAKNLGDDDGDSSPPLWKTKSQHFQGNFQNLSPDSRAQEIARGQKEMMEMVKNMPESCYELTLKDIVDHQRIEGKNFQEKRRINVIKRSESGGKMVRSSSSDHKGGLLLKMACPVSIMGKQKKKSENVTKSKILPKPDNSDKSSKNVEKDWWKKTLFFGSSSSDSRSAARASSRGSNYSRGSKKGGCLHWHISLSFLSKQSKNNAK